jgi:hypothetical protein
MNVPDLRDPNFIKEPKHVDDTKMLDTTARESVNMNEANDNKEHVTTHASFGPLGAKGRN